ncbi:hypothetical protein D3C83_32110 [compost metagenome]
MPSSRKRPKGFSTRRLRLIASPASELSTTSTPRPLVIERISSLKASERESSTWSAPSRRRKSRFSSEPAVAKISAPLHLAIWMAAMPTPPAAPWMRIFSPSCRRARWLSE